MAQRQRRRREQQQLSRLCDLVAASLLPHLETKPPAPQLTREDERRILLALSRVNKVIRGWEEEEQECEFDQEVRLWLNSVECLVDAYVILLRKLAHAQMRNSISDRAVVVFMAEAVGSAVAQETVSRAVSFVLSNREAAASKSPPIPLIVVRIPNQIPPRSLGVVSHIATEGIEPSTIDKFS